MQDEERLLTYRKVNADCGSTTTLVAAGQRGEFFPYIWTNLVRPMEQRCEIFNVPFWMSFFSISSSRFFLGSKEYGHLSFRYDSHSEPLDPTSSANEFNRGPVDLADWLVDTGLINSIPLVNDPRCPGLILWTLWIIRLGCIVIP